MSPRPRPPSQPARTQRLMLRRLGKTLIFAIVRGIGYATGSTLVTALIWWLTSR